MRQFLISNGTLPHDGDAVDASTAYGAVGLAYIDKSDNKMKFGIDGILGDGEGYLVMIREAEKGGNVVLPLHKNHFSYVKGEYNASMSGKFSAEFTIADVDPFLDYTVIVVKKGKQFNERNKWTATVHSKASDTPATIAQKLADAINANIGAEVEATVSTATITIEGLIDDQDYNIVLADELIDVEVENVSHVMKPYGDVAYITDLANKAAADAGFEYTYQDDLKLLYPNYPIDVLNAVYSGEKPTFTIFTIRCAEPRDMKTRDEVVHQIIQLAVPTGSDAVAGLDNAFTALLDPSRNIYD